MSNTFLEKYADENPNRNAVVVILRDDNHYMLLVRTKKLPHWWQPVGGGVEPEDGSPVDAVIRETLEEVGLKLDPEKLQQTMELPYDFGKGTIIFFEAEFDRKQSSLLPNKDEIIEHGWFSTEESLNLPTLPAFSEYLKETKT